MEESIVPVDQIAVHSSTSYEFSNQNKAEIVELEDDPLDVVERKMEGLKLDHQFKEENVPQFFRTFVIDKIDDLLNIEFDFYDSYCTMKFTLTDDQVFNVRFEKRRNSWMICYNDGEKTIESKDPEKSIIDHLWFVLKHPKLELDYLGIINRSNSKRKSALLNFEKFELLFQSMLNSIDHPIYIDVYMMMGFNEDTFLSMLQHIDPETLYAICFEISWKEDGNYQKMNEIIETEQWKQAESIDSYGINSLKIEDLLRCEKFWLKCDRITPEDVLRVRDNMINKEESEDGILESKEDIDFNEIEKVLPSNCMREKRFDARLGHQIVYTYKIPNSRDSLIVELSENQIIFVKNASSF